ncbi:DNA-directed RNA polymerase subunit RPC12/RpoP [Paraburkholderia sp. CI3]
MDGRNAAPGAEGLVLYVYRCAACGYRGQLYFADDSHEGEAVICASCDGAASLEWDGGVTFAPTKE